MNTVLQPKPSAIWGFVAKASSALGTIWTAAGVLKLVFGVRVTLPLFPPIDLERVAEWPSILVGLALVFVGAWLRRSATVVPDIGPQALPTDATMQQVQAPQVDLDPLSRPATAESIVLRRPYGR
jgi:hypothetical protein